MLFFIFKIVFVLMILWFVVQGIQSVLRKKAQGTVEETKEKQAEDDWKEF